MSRRGSEKRKLAGQVLVRLTEAQQQAVAAHAQAAQVTAASWLRLLIADAVSVDPGPRTTRAVPPEIVVEVTQMRELLAEIGGALVQATIAAREDGRHAEHQRIEALLPEVKAVVRDVDQLKERLWPRGR